MEIIKYLAIALLLSSCTAHMKVGYVIRDDERTTRERDVVRVQSMFRKNTNKAVRKMRRTHRKSNRRKPICYGI